MKIISFLTVAVLFSTSGYSQDRPQVLLPADIYCNPYADVSMYYINVTQNPGAGPYRFRITGCPGKKYQDRYTFTIDKRSSKDFRLHVKVSDQKSPMKLKMHSTVHYTKVKKAPADTVNILIVGNSLTARGVYPAKVQSYLRDSVGFPVKFLGTKKSNGGIHEGYGGKTWKWFGHHGDSPFVFRTADNDSILDFHRYFSEVVHAEPDIVVIFLGINDCFRADTTSVAAIDQTIDKMLSEATFFLNKLIEYRPGLQIGICLTPPANDRTEAFRHNYGDKYTRSGWKKIQRRLVERYITFFDGHFQSNCSLIPVEINIDTYTGYPDDNAVHPNVYGYHQIAASIFSWIYYRLD
jgi:lysophospholipase L1-like esterase